MPKDALQLLKDDHEEVQELMERMVATSNQAVRTREKLRDQIVTMLETHTTIEEEIFYPALEQCAESEDDRRIVLEAHEEHDAARKVIEDLKACDPSTTEFVAVGKVLCELVDHHVEEEEGPMFRRARKLMEKQLRVELGERMEARKEELLGAVV